MSVSRRNFLSSIVATSALMMTNPVLGCQLNTDTLSVNRMRQEVSHNIRHMLMQATDKNGPHHYHQITALAGNKHYLADILLGIIQLSDWDITVEIIQHENWHIDSEHRISCNLIDDVDGNAYAIEIVITGTRDNLIGLVDHSHKYTGEVKIGDIYIMHIGTTEKVPSDINPNDITYQYMQGPAHAWLKKDLPNFDKSEFVRLVQIDIENLIKGFQNAAI